MRRGTARFGGGAGSRNGTRAWKVRLIEAENSTWSDLFDALNRPDEPLHPDLLDLIDPVTRLPRAAQTQLGSPPSRGSKRAIDRALALRGWVRVLEFVAQGDGDRAADGGQAFDGPGGELEARREAERVGAQFGVGGAVRVEQAVGNAAALDDLAGHPHARDAIELQLSERRRGLFG